MEEKTREREKSEVRAVRFSISEDKMIGVYSNVARITHSLHDFTIDFGTFIPEKDTFEILARIKLSPSHAKVFLQALRENVASYEKKFGAINVGSTGGHESGQEEQKKEDLTYIG